jgi:hypothetical protein
MQYACKCGQTLCLNLSKRQDDDGKRKVKAIPVQARTGPEGSRLRHMKVLRSSALRTNEPVSIV